MNPSLRRNTCENAINKESISSTVAEKNKPEPKIPVISYDYEAAISQPDIPMYSNVDNNTQNSSWSEPSNELSAPTKKRNFYVRGKAGVTTKKKGIVFKSKTQAKKIIKTRSVCDVIEVKKESIPPSEIIRDVEDYRKENKDDITLNRPTSLNQKNLVHSRDVQKTLGKIDKNLTNEAAGVFQENSEIEKDTRSFIPQNKISKIPRIKPSIKQNSFLPINENSRVYPSAKLSMRNELKCFTDIKSPADNGKEKLIFDSERETLYAVNQKLRIKNILPIINENSNLWCPEKSSAIDADEEFEGDLLTSMKESPIITDAGDDPRSATLLKSLALKCECRSCNDKYASMVHAAQHTDTESWSSPELEKSARKRKSMRHRKFIDASSEDLDLLSDCNAINFNNDNKTNTKNNESNIASHITKQSSIVNHTRMKTYRTTNLSFFNVFFDIVFWPFVFLRSKQ